MSSTSDTISNVSRVERELYFLIGRFLSAGPCQGAAKVLLDEMREHQLLPMRIDWEGDEHYRTYDSLASLYRHIRTDHLLKICQRISPLLDKEVTPSVTGVASLLGAGRQSMLRTIDDVKYSHWKPDIHVALRHNRPLQPPSNLSHPPHLVHILNARLLTGQQRFDHGCHTRMYSRVTQLSRSLGHLSAVYCLCFDRTGEYFFTGADDHLIKIWSTFSGRLMGTLRGHSAEITDMAVSFENTLLASGSCDKFVRVWCLRSLAPVAVLHSHTGMVTSLQFCPYQRGSTRYLASTGGDGCVCFWKWQVDTNKFDTKPTKFIEKSRAGAQMLCSSFSPGGIFLTTGNSDQVIRVYSLAGPLIEKICELEAHTDRVDSIAYSNCSSRFVTGSKDGFARVWRFERQEWRNLVLNVARTMDSKPNAFDLGEMCAVKLRVTMVCWNCDDTKVITAVSNCTLKVWDSHTADLLKILECHQDEVFVLENNPVDPRIILSAGHDGHIIVWDMITGNVVKKYFNNIQGQGHGAVFDCKWAPDGQGFAATDSHGFIMYFGFGSNDIYRRLPEDMFFHTDYRPLIRDANDYVLDEQTQQPPHLMPPPFLVDIDGNPHPPRYQKLVPGREGCQDTQLVPQLGVLPNGDREVLDDVLELIEQAAAPEVAPPVEPEPEEDEDGDRIIDRMIEHLQQEQDQRIAAAGGEPLRVSISDHGEVGDELRSPRIEGPLSPPVRGLRRSGEEEGVRQALGNVPVSHQATDIDLANWRRRVVVRELETAVRKSNARKHHQVTDDELKKFLSERKKKPLPHSGDSSDSSSYMKTRHRKRPRHGFSMRSGLNEETTVNRLATRALYDTEEEEETEETPGGTTEELDEEVAPPPGEESDQMWKSSSDGESSDYSDWTADAGLSLQPPKRRSARQVKRRHFSSEDSDEEDDDQESEGEAGSDDSGPSTSRQPKKKPSVRKKPLRQTKREKRQQQKKKKLLNEQNGITELPEAYRIPEWLTESIPRKSPYFPQMGDEVMYFRQGHELYTKAVKLRKAYEVDLSRNLPWHKIPDLREVELVKVVGLKYEVKPPRLVCLKLALINADTGKTTGGKFTVKYHDMADVIDFIVLKENFDIAMRRKWKVGDHFRSLIDDAWWMGVIESQIPFEEDHVDSVFQCFTVHWDNGEIEKMSPWDLEPLDDNRLPRMKGGSVPVTDQELHALMFQPKPSDWPAEGRDEVCDRIIQALDKVMELSIAEHFLAPVDLNAFPEYGMSIAYPIDLSLIKERLEKRFYRRLNAIQFDVRHIDSNAVAFNETKSKIVKLAKQVTELCLRVISDPDCFDPMPIYNELVKDTDFTIGSSERKNSQSDDADVSGTSRPLVGRGSSNCLPKTRKLQVNLSPTAWKAQCRQLLDIVFECEDSQPFRHAVDPEAYPEYYAVIDHPMDLCTVKEHLACDGYDTPVEFCRDVRLVFNNSKQYNTNKRSRIYVMTLRLAAMFEEHVKEVITGWKTASKGRRMSRRRPSPRKSAQSTLSPSVSCLSTSPRSNFSSPLSTSRSSKVSRMTSSGSSAQSKIKALSRRQDRAVRVVRRILDDTDDDEIEEPEQDDKTEEDSDSDYDLCKSKNTARSKSSQKKTPAKKKGKSVKKLVNGHSARYGTRVSTGSIQRKKYGCVMIDASDNNEKDNDSATSEDSDNDRKPPKPSLSKGIVSRPQLKPKGSSRRRRIESDQEADDDVKPKRKLRKVQVHSSEDEVDTPPKRKSRTRGLPQVSESEKDEREDKEDEDEDTTENESGSEKSDNSETENSSSSSSSEELTTRTTRASARQSSSRPAPREPRKHSIECDFVHKSSKSKRYGTRNRGQRTVQYHEDSEDNEAVSEEEVTSVSSRGRVRRMTPRARAIFS